jgi:DNA-binding CsgD family transcriptional regulator
VARSNPLPAPPWQHLVAVGLVAGDLSPTVIARCAEVPVATVALALQAAHVAGAVSLSGEVDPALAAELVAALPADLAALVHNAVARRLLTTGSGSLDEAVRHARLGAGGNGTAELVAAADRAGRTALAVRDYARARQLLELAEELDEETDLSNQAERLCDLARAVEGLGDVAGGREHLSRAATLAEIAGDAHRFAVAAVQYALPTGWDIGDERASGLLRRAEQLDLDDDDRTLVTAARAISENRIPLQTDTDQQVAWVTRPSHARRLADEALAASTTSPPARLLALQAWRTTHRAPAFLERRLTVSAEALDLAQQLQSPSDQIETAVMLATDALEAGDRAHYDRAVAVARWVAARDGNPRLVWRAHTLAAGAAHLDGQLDEGVACARAARAVGEPAGVQGWLGAELVFTGQTVLHLDQPEAMRPFLFGDAEPVMANPLARAGVAYCFARCGDTDAAERYARRAFRQLDEEASYLLLATLLAATAAECRSAELQRELVGILQPWTEHVAVDSNAWWCNGPVSLWSAHLHAALGEPTEALDLLDMAEPLADAMGDVRARRRAASLRRRLGEHRGAGPTPTGPEPRTDLLTAREHDVLRLLAGGATNAEIAAVLAFSVSTIRNDSVSIYRKLEVRGRAEAVRRAVALGLLDRD